MRLFGEELLDHGRWKERNRLVHEDHDSTCD